MSRGSNSGASGGAPPSIVAEEVPSQESLNLPPINLAVETGRLLWGLSFRYMLACGTWYGIYRAFDTFKRVPDKVSEQRRGKRFRMWALSHAADVGVSLLLVPGRYLTGKTAPRLLFDFTFMTWGDVLSKFDLFAGRQYLSYAVNRLTPANGAEYDYSFLLWQAPSTVLTAVKLYQRFKRCPQQTSLVKAVLAMGLHFFIRLMVMSFALYLPRSEEELIITAIMVGMEKTLDAYLIRNTWPWPDQLGDVAPKSLDAVA
jgi:hypothetical protein